MTRKTHILGILSILCICVGLLMGCGQVQFRIPGQLTEADTIPAVDIPTYPDSEAVVSPDTDPSAVTDLPVADTSSPAETDADRESDPHEDTGSSPDTLSPDETLPGLTDESDTTSGEESETIPAIESDTEPPVTHETTPETRPVEPHVHTYAEAWTSDDTHHWHMATCEHTDETSAEAAHRWGEGQVSRAATCTEDGERVYTCVDCARTRSESIPSTGHAAMIDPSVAPTCTTPGMTEGIHCGTCGDILTVQNAIPATGHATIADPAVAPTCTTPGMTEGVHCGTCGDILTVQNTIPATGHTMESGTVLLPTWSEAGQSGGEACTVCREVLVSGRTLPPLAAMNSRAGYVYFTTMENGEALTTLYDRLDKVATAFHLDTSVGVGSDDEVGRIPYADLGLTEDDVQMVWMTYKADHPLFYWISTTVAWTDTHLYLLTDPLYADGGTRAACNRLIIGGVLDLLVDEASPYLTALHYHDAIIDGMDYAYEADGRTPEDAIWAHSIMGYFEMESGVCESYARTFQLLLNYSGVENLFVTGYAGEAHAWNLVRMDDDGYYWFDLTWDDTPTLRRGISYDYFCVNDTEGIGFLSSHTPDTPAGIGLDFLYALPERSERPFADATLPMLGRIFAADGYTCMVIGDDAVEISTIEQTGDVIIPETICYDGRVYTVVSLCNLQNGEGASILAPGTTSVHIPQTVDFIFESALSLESLASITVDERNDDFTAVDGVLFTKRMYTLVQYPTAHPRTNYTVPDMTEHIAYNAFIYGGNLEELTFGKGVNLVGVTPRPYAARYYDGGEMPPVGVVGNELLFILDSLVGARRLSVSADNTAYVVADGALYSSDMTVLYLILDLDKTTYTLPATVTAIDNDPNAVFGLCYFLTELHVETGNTHYRMEGDALYDQNGQLIYQLQLIIN